jgi:uncharacterized NAD(P)/FAD-binding protein YdhS
MIHNNMFQESKYAIAIVGAGFSGTLAAIQCFRYLETQNLEYKNFLVFLIEQNSQFALGAAYSTNRIEHLLNVPAWNMSAFPEDKNHFLDWLAQNNYNFNKTDLVPRQIYGKYLQSLLAETKAKCTERLQLIHGKIIAIDSKINGYELHCEDGQKLNANQVLLTLGNFPPQNPPLKDPAFFVNSKLYWQNPWQIDRDPIPKNSTCLIIGTGLTMVDKVLELEASGHTGKIIALSRHGFLPMAHSSVSLNPVLKPWTMTELKGYSQSPRKLLRFLREQVEMSSSQDDYDWRIEILKLRPLIQSIWKQWPVKEKKRFLRHCRAWWDVRRHLIDNVVSNRLDALQQSGQLKILAGRLESLEENGGQIFCKYLDRHTQVYQEFVCDQVINCIGPDGRIRHSQDTLLSQLRDSGQIQADDQGLGILVDDQYRVIGKNGKVQTHLFSMGPLLKGVLWESIAVPELRQQAEQIVRIIVS